jgi:Glyoxalase/Bleomycin resistance protein/Dioxygenase superfamily
MARASSRVEPLWPSARVGAAVIGAIRAAVATVSRIARVVPYEPSNEVTSFLNIRVADIEACYRNWKAKGAEFVTEPIDRVAEVRCYMRDPDGYLIEVGQATGILEGKFAKKRPEGLPG